MTPFHFVRPLLFALPPERAHRVAIAALKRLPHRAASHDPALSIRVAGLDFPSPIGLAAGLDKDAEAPDALLAAGFGFVEVGTVTPLPQSGNPAPRLFRLAADRAVINRLGFNSGGQEAMRRRLVARAGRPGIVGVNIGANKESADRIGDYERGVQAMAPVATYLTINISSPNTPGLRNLQDGSALDDLLARAMAARGPAGPPIFLKIAPDLSTAEIDRVVRVAIERGADALVIGNTTVTRPPLRSRDAGEGGGLSGAPLAALARAKLRDCRVASGGALPLIAAGGIASGEDAYARIRAGASLVQIYSALVFEGPGLPRRIGRDLIRLLRRDGFATVEAAIGIDAA